MDQPSNKARALLALAAIVGLSVAACGTGGSPSNASSPSASGGSTPGCGTPAGAPSGSASPPAGSPQKLVVGLGYIPSVQFAQFYLAQQAGYYRDSGLEVTFQNGRDSDLIPLAAQGALDIALADGTSVIPAVSQGIPVKYVASIYEKFPNIVFAKPSSGITKAGDLKGRKVGTPGKYGSSWIMLQAILASAYLTTDDVEFVLYPEYTQLAGLEQGQVDAATGFANNEPVQLKNQTGTNASLIRVDDIVPLPGNGLIVGTKTIELKRDAVALFVAATLRAMDDIAVDPERGLGAASAVVPEVAKGCDVQREVLKATIDLWRDELTDRQGLGSIDRNAWAASIDFMSRLPGGLVAKPVSVDDVVDDSLVPVR